MQKSHIKLSIPQKKSVFIRIVVYLDVALKCFPQIETISINIYDHLMFKVQWQISQFGRTHFHETREVVLKFKRNVSVKKYL